MRKTVSMVNPQRERVRFGKEFKLEAGGEMGRINVKLIWRMSVFLAALLSLGTTVDAQTQKPPIVLGTEEPESIKRLMLNPNDQNLWQQQLQREQSRFEALSRYALENPDDPLAALGMANNLHLQGIALRHLKQYREALGLLSRSTQALADIKEQQRCYPPKVAPVCEQIARQELLVATSFATVYQELKDDANSEKYLKLVLDLSSRPNEFRRALSVLVSWYLRKDNLEGAVQVTLDEIKAVIGRSQRDKVVAASHVAESLYRQLYEGISWIPETRKRRSNDPRDFADNFGLGIGRSFKYGMVNPDEDDATMVTLFVQQELVMLHPEDIKYAREYGYPSGYELKRNLDVEEYVRAQLTEGHFEFAAKYLYYKHLWGRFYSTDTSYLRCSEARQSEILFPEVKEKLDITPSLTVSPETRRRINLFTLGNEFLLRNCFSEK